MSYSATSIAPAPTFWPANNGYVGYEGVTSQLSPKRSPERARPRTQPKYISPKMQINTKGGPHPLSQPPITAPDSFCPPPSLSKAPDILSSPIEQPVPQRRRFSFPASLAAIHESTIPCIKGDAPIARSSDIKVDIDGLDSKQHIFNGTDQTGAQISSPPDEFWRRLLSQTVDVEGVGRVSVSRFMTEVWKRGGPNSVSEHCLWPSVLVSLSQSFHSASGRAPIQQPTAEATLALQALYNVAIRPNEVTIFSGFLSSVSNAERADGGDSNQVYGAWTPTKPAAEVDLSQWTTLTPGSEWPSLSTTLASGSGLTPGRPFSPALGLPPIEYTDTAENPSRPESRTEGGGGIKGIDEILAQLEDNEAMRETESEEPVPELLHPTSDEAAAKSNSDNSEPSSRSGSVATMMDNMLGSAASSPFVSATSLFSATSASTKIPTAAPAPTQPQHEHQQHQQQHQQQALHVADQPRQHRQGPGMQLTIPAPPFIPPLPMCMFFSPSFRDLQTGKVAVWKGDLTVRGRGGGTFNILIVGEEGSDNLWQSHLWGDSLSYPPGPVMTESATATMIPVSTLAREGLLPVTMGMVLCNDENIAQYVSMVQGLHAEGVAFHLPGSTLPIVFLPSKFDSADPLQRLGVAFMTKGGVNPFPTRSPSPKTSTSSSGDAGDSDEARPKRRRKSRSVNAKTDSSNSPTSPTKTIPRRKSAPRRTRSKTLDGMSSLRIESN